MQKDDIIYKAVELIADDFAAGIVDEQPLIDIYYQAGSTGAIYEIAISYLVERLDTEGKNKERLKVTKEIDRYFKSLNLPIYNKRVRVIDAIDIDENFSEVKIRIQISPDDVEKNLKD